MPHHNPQKKGTRQTREEVTFKVSYNLDNRRPKKVRRKEGHRTSKTCWGEGENSVEEEGGRWLNLSWTVQKNVSNRKEKKARRVLTLKPGEKQYILEGEQERNLLRKA